MFECLFKRSPAPPLFSNIIFSCREKHEQKRPRWVSGNRVLGEKDTKRNISSSEFKSYGQK